MKRLLPLLLIFALSGCFGAQSPSEFAAESRALSDGSNEQAVTNACLQWVENKDKLELASYDKIPDKERSFALMHRETMSMVKDVWGKGNECKPGTNQWDAYIAYVKEIEESHRQYSTDLKSVATFGIVTTGAVKLVDSLAGAVGDKISTTGDNSGVTKTTTTTSSTNTAVAADKSTATNNATAGSKEGEAAATGKTPTAAQWADCTTVASGAASNSEINACLQRDYGINSSECNGGICIDGHPFTGI
jgi:hypothetical protein